MNVVSRYKMGFIGMRLDKIGRARELMQKKGAMFFKPSDEPNGFTVVFAVKFKENLTTAFVEKFHKQGARGVAFWISDAQWGNMEQMTREQFKNRVSFLETIKQWGKK